MVEGALRGKSGWLIISHISLPSCTYHHEYIVLMHYGGRVVLLLLRQLIM